MESRTELRKYSALEGLWRNFYDRNFYAAVALKWTGVSFGYLFIVSALFSLLILCSQYFRFVSVLHSPQLETMFSAMPALQIKDGIMNTDSHELKVLRLQEAVSNNHDNNFEKPAKGVQDTSTETKGTRLIILDPKDSLKGLDEAQAPVLLQSKQFLVRMKAGRQPMKLSYKQFFQDGKISGKMIQAKLKGMVAILLLPLFLIVSLLHLSFVLTRAMLIGLFLKLFRLKQSFASIIRLLVVASTPASLLTAVSMLLNLDYGRFEQPLFTGIFLGYAVYAFNCLRAAKNS